MDQPPIQPNPPPPPPPQKSHTLLIVLGIIGALFLVLIGGCFLLVRSCARKVSNFAQETQREYDQNPQLAVLSAAAAIHPDLEVVSKDFAKGVITIHNKKTGETVTIDTTKLSDPELQKKIGQFSQGLASALGSAVTTASDHALAEAQPTADAPAISATRQAKAAAAVARFPAWVLRFEQGKPSSASTSQSGDRLTGRYTFSQAGDLAALGDATEGKLKAAAFAVTRDNSLDAGGDRVTITATRAKGKETLRIELTQSEGGPIEGTVSFTSENTP